VKKASFSLASVSGGRDKRVARADRVAIETRLAKLRKSEEGVLTATA
jgi:hypothetical protein